MSRVKGGFTRARKHRKVKALAKGFLGARRRTFKGAKEGILHALDHAYVGRRLKKQTMRRLWIVRINAALAPHKLSYSRFINLLKIKNILLDRKSLSELAITDPITFDKIVSDVVR